MLFFLKIKILLAVKVIAVKINKKNDYVKNDLNQFDETSKKAGHVKILLV